MDLHQKATIIIGDSGRGKSLFTKLVIENIEYNNKDVKISISDSEYRIKILNSNWYAIIDNAIDNNEKDIFIADDVDFVITPQFSEIYKRCKNCYFIIINRFDDFDLSSLSRIPFSASEIYNFYNNGREHSIKNLISDEVSSNYIPFELSAIVTEDEGYGLKFLKKHFGDNVYTTYGKDNILDYFLENEDKFAYKSIYLFVDISGYGSSFHNFMTFMKRSKVNIVFCSWYECFEYMILKSNMFNFVVDDREVLLFNSFEKYCEYKLEQMTKGKPYKISHDEPSYLSDCYVEDCCYKSSKNCRIGLSGDKLEALFRGTDFEFLLNMK